MSVADQPPGSADARAGLRRVTRPTLTVRTASSGQLLGALRAGSVWPGAHYGRGFRLAIILGMVGLFFGLLTLQNALWHDGREPVKVWEHILGWLSISWILPLPAAVVGFIGLMMYRAPMSPVAPVDRMDRLVSFRVVSRGQNRAALAGTVANIRAQMRYWPLFPYRIEVVTDIPVDLGANADLTQAVVPPDYQTAKGSLFKARALHYMLEHSDLPDEAWIMHLDEESHISASLVAGIRSAVTEEEERGTYRIGQGAILYQGNLRTHTFLTLADMIRTGEDLSRFHFQHRLGTTIFGLHGSFILVQNRVEKEVGFDFGPVGSLTEDAFWALREMENGRRCRWVDGFLVEQSTQSVRDFIRQRRRWFVGLVLVALAAPVALKYRLAIGISTALWAVSWISVLYTYLNLLSGVLTPWWIQLGGNFIFAYYVVQYVVGLKLNLDNYPPFGGRQTLRFYVLQVIFIPVFQVLEGIGVVYGLVKPEVGFHVVLKT